MTGHRRKTQGHTPKAPFCDQVANPCATALRMPETTSCRWRSSLGSNLGTQLHRLLIFFVLGVLTIVAVLSCYLVQVKRFEAARSGLAQRRGSAEICNRKNGYDLATLLEWRIRNQTERNIWRATDAQYHGWHPQRIESAEFLPVNAIQPGRLELVRHPDFGTTPVLLKIADPHEATMYRILYGLGVTPSFLGHVTQDGAIVGFITEFVETREVMVVPGNMSKRKACLAALQRIHTRGVAHRDAHGENCLLRPDGSAALIDFELSAESSSRSDFDRDLWVMYHTVLD